MHCNKHFLSVAGTLVLALTSDAFTSGDTCFASRSHLCRSSESPTSLFSNANENNEKIIQLKKEIAKDLKLKEKYAAGKELQDLRSDIQNFKANLVWAEAIKDEGKIRDLKEAIRQGENRDPDLVFKRTLKMIDDLQKSNAGQSNPQEYNRLIDLLKREAKAARSCMPRFLLDGLWVGNYGGEDGYQIVNVTYSGDALVATKVTGDKRVPRGAVTFEADMSVRNITTGESHELPPIELTQEAAKKWGMDKLERFPGQGQIAKDGFEDNKMVDGQLIFYGNQFSFVWTATRQHVFFGRPSDAVVLKLLRDTVSKEDVLENKKEYLTRCFNLDEDNLSSTSMTESSSQRRKRTFRRIANTRDLKRIEESVDPTTTTALVHKFWDISRWRACIDGVLGDVSKDGQQH